jgi:hypothetical protein
MLNMGILFQEYVHVPSHRMSTDRQTDRQTDKRVSVKNVMT